MNLKEGDFDLFCKVIDETLILFDDLIKLESKKIDAISENDVTLLDQYMNDEQVFLLQMRNLDFKREKVLEQIGAPGSSFRQVIDEYEGTEKETLNSLFKELSAKSSELKEVITTTKRFIDLHLNSITALLNKMDDPGEVYNKSGEKEPKDPPKRFKPTKA